MYVSTYSRYVTRRKQLPSFICFWPEDGVSGVMSCAAHCTDYISLDRGAIETRERVIALVEPVVTEQ